MKIYEFGREHKDTIILLHGGGLSWWNYREEAMLLKDRFRVVLPVLDGHADSGNDFAGIEENAERIISLIDREFGTSVLLMGGLSLGAQILTEILSRRENICRFAVIESAAVIPSKITNALTGPALSSGYGLIKNKNFAKMQFKYLRIREDLFEDYYRDTAKITKDNMTAFLKANTAYEVKPGLKNCRAKVRIAVGEKEQPKILRSAEILHSMLPGSRLEIKDGLYHGEYSLNCPELYVKEMLEMIERN